MSESWVGEWDRVWWAGERVEKKTAGLWEGWWWGPGHPVNISSSNKLKMIEQNCRNDQGHASIDFTYE